MRPVVVALALVGPLASARAWADCAIPDRFAEHERAARVVLAEATGAAGAYRVRLRVLRTLKGASAPSLLRVSFNPLAGESYQGGHRYLVFLDDKGTPAGGCTAVEETRASQPLVQALAAWGSAGPPRGRTEFLVHLGTGKDRLAATEALAHLASRPDLLVEVTATDRDALVKAVAGAGDARIHPLAWVLARLHALEAMPAFVAWLGAPHLEANPRPVQDALELMTNHHDPAYTPGRDFWGEEAARLRAGWQRWYAAHRAEPVDKALAAGFVERGQAPVSLTDRAALAAILKKGQDPLSCAVSLDACERLARARSSRLPTSFGGHVDWAALADACAP